MLAPIYEREIVNIFVSASFAPAYPRRICLYDFSTMLAVDVYSPVLQSKEKQSRRRETDEETK